MNNEKMIGALHAFVLLKPTLNKAMQTCNRIDDSLKFMHSHGYPTHHLADRRGAHSNSLPSDSVPVLTRDDTCKFLEMDYKTVLVSDHMRLIFQNIKRTMD